MGIKAKFKREDIITAIQSCLKSLKEKLAEYEKEQATYETRLNKFFSDREKFVRQVIKDYPKQVRSDVNDNTYNRSVTVELKVTIPYEHVPKAILDEKKPQPKENQIDRYKREIDSAESSLKFFQKAQDEFISISTISEKDQIEKYMKYL
jgi:hypothetical protein